MALAGLVRNEGGIGIGIGIGEATMLFFPAGSLAYWGPRFRLRLSV